MVFFILKTIIDIALNGTGQLNYFACPFEIFKYYGDQQIYFLMCSFIFNLEIFWIKYLLKYKLFLTNFLKLFCQKILKYITTQKDYTQKYEFQ